MPTILLLDLTASLGRLIAPDLTRQDLVQRCVLHFLRALEEQEPHECLAMAITNASSATLVVPFTRDHSLLRSALYDVQLQEKTRLDVGLQHVFQSIEDKWGLEQAVQVVVFTDCPPAVDAKQVLSVRTLVRVRLHVVAFGSKIEMSSSDSLRQLAHSYFGCFSFLQLPEVRL